MKPLRTLLTLLAMLVLATSAGAQFVEFSVIAGGQSVYGPSPQFLDYPFAGGSYNSTGRSRAASDRGVVRSHAWIENDYTCVCTPQLENYARAIVDLTTINITGPPGPVSGTLHLTLEGRLDWAGQDPWASSVSIQVLSGMIGYSTGELAYHPGAGLATSGLLAGSGAIVDTTYDFPFTIEPGAWDLMLILETYAGGTSFGSGFNQGLADFFSDRNGDGIGGFHFPTNGPAITLPAGYAANSADLNIVNNYWQSPTVAVADPGRTQRLSLRLGANPVRPGTEVRYALPRAGIVRLEVLDVQGRSVAMLEDGWRAAGEHRVTWPSGGAPGMYFVRASFEGRSVTHKAAVLN